MMSGTHCQSRNGVVLAETARSVASHRARHKRVNREYKDTHELTLEEMQSEFLKEGEIVRICRRASFSRFEADLSAGEAARNGR